MQDVARCTGLRRESIWGHVKRGNLPAARIGNQYAIKVSDMQEFIRKRAKGFFTWQHREAARREHQP
jgi:predicted DNA-binding transcriptional regulator AlpA